MEIYEPSRYNRFEKDDGHYYFIEEGELIGYGMGAHSLYENKYEISKDEFDQKIVYADTINGQKEAEDDDLNEEQIQELYDSLSTIQKGSFLFKSIINNKFTGVVIVILLYLIEFIPWKNVRVPLESFVDVFALIIIIKMLRNLLSQFFHKIIKR